MTAIATAIGGVVGAYLAGRSFWPVLLWSLPGIGVGAAFSLIGLAIAVGASLGFLALGITASSAGPVIALASAALMAFSLASILSGPMTLMGVIYAEDQMAKAPSAEASSPRIGSAPQRF